MYVHQSIHAAFARWCAEPEIVKRWLPLKDALRAYPVTRDCYGAIHNDLHQWNFLYKEGPGGGTLTIIDFDECGYHYFNTSVSYKIS